MPNHCYENVSRLQVHFHAHQAHFLVNGFALGPVLKHTEEKGNSKMTSYGVDSSKSNIINCVYQDLYLTGQKTEKITR